MQSDEALQVLQATASTWAGVVEAGVRDMQAMRVVA